MRSDQNDEFRRKRALRACEDILRYPQVMTDQRLVRAVNKLLTPEEREDVDFLGGIVAGTKIILVCKDPTSLREVIMIGRRNPKKVYRRRLSLKRKNYPAQV